MNEILTGNFGTPGWQFWPPQNIRVVNWNIDRGLRLRDVEEFLAAQRADLVTLQEVDLHAKRTLYRNIAEDIARRLQMNYVFGREFQELTQGSKTAPAYHGQATLSRWPLRNPRLIRFRSQSDFWRPRWFLPTTAPFQERLGGRIALATEISLAGRPVAVYNVHLESRGNDSLRASQLREALRDSCRYLPRVPTLLAGDLNFDVSQDPGAGVVRQAGFRSVFGESRLYTRPAHTFFDSPRSIDWALIAGSVSASGGRVHAIHASDHYPLSFTLRFV